MNFPKKEWSNIKKNLKKGKCSTVRCCKELGRYKKGQIHGTPWGDRIKIIGVKRYSEIEKIPTFDQMTKGMKISLRFGERYGKNKWDHIIFKKK